MAIEEPEYQVVRKLDDFELRHYPPYLVAEVDVQGDFDDAGNKAFRILAGYIFGDNSITEKMSMTAPVESRSAPASEKMAMTAPVSSTAAADSDQKTFAFVMERKYTLETLPVPNDDRIRIREVPERTMAVRRYSGRWTESKYLQNKEVLRSALEASGIQTIGRPTLARYNSPFSLPTFRRNEVMIEVHHKDTKVAAQ
ncbi:MAG: heme-binding protein [Gammaproteobacteria bacterium]|nr:heme-binding protein [Gammaproteobacteria bacterium]